MLDQISCRDFLTGKLSEQDAYCYLLDSSKRQPTALAIKEFVRNIKEISSDYLNQIPVINVDLIDCCGTGGSGLAHYNTSTTVSFVLAAAGLKVTKFGNRAITGQSGSFDFLDSLQIPVISSIETTIDILQETNLAFVYAGQFYPFLAKFGPIRKRIGRPTIMNIIGPLLNPFDPSFRLLGAAQENHQMAIGQYLIEESNNKNAFVVHSYSGLDELDPSSNNKILAVNKSGIKERELMAEKGLGTFTRQLTAEVNAQYFKKIVSDFHSLPEYFRSLILLNSAAGLVVSGKAKTFLEGQHIAEQLLLSGKVLAKYEQCRRIYNKYAR